MAISSVDSLVANVVKDLHDIVDMYVPDVELLVVDMAEDLHVSLVADLSLHITEMNFIFEDFLLLVVISYKDFWQGTMFILYLGVTMLIG